MKVISHIQNRPQKSKAEIDAISLFWSEKDIEMDGAKSPIAFVHYKTALEDFSVDSLKNWITYIKNANDTF